MTTPPPSQSSTFSTQIADLLPEIPSATSSPSSPPSPPSSLFSQNPKREFTKNDVISSVPHHQKPFVRQFSSGSVHSRLGHHHKNKRINSQYASTKMRKKPLYYEDLDETYQGLNIASFQSLREVLHSKKGTSWHEMDGEADLKASQSKTGSTVSEAMSKLEGFMTGRSQKTSHRATMAKRTTNAIANSSTQRSSKRRLIAAHPRASSSTSHFSHHAPKKRAPKGHRASASLVKHKHSTKDINRLEIHSADHTWDRLHEELAREASEKQLPSQTRYTNATRNSSTSRQQKSLSSFEDSASTSPNPFSKKINIPLILKQWDAAPSTTKNKLLRQFYDQFHNVPTFRNMEQQLEHFTHLLFMRFTAFLRMQYLHRKGSSLIIQLRVLKLYLRGQKPLLQFLEIGGTALLMDLLCDARQSPEVRIEAIDLISLICNTGKKYKELVVGVDNGLEALERVSLFGQLSEDAFLKLQLLWIDLCKNNPKQFERIEEALVRMFNRCKSCVPHPGANASAAAYHGLSDAIQHQLGAPSPLTTTGGGGAYSNGSGPNPDVDLQDDATTQPDSEHLVRAALMLCRIFRELHQQHIGIQSLLTKDSIDTQMIFLLHHDFPQIQLEVSHLLLHNITQDDAGHMQLHIAEKLIQILSQHSDGTNTRNIPGCSRLILQLINTHHSSIIELFLRCQVHLLLFDAMRDLNPIDYLVDTVKHICATIHSLVQYADPKQSAMIREGVSKRIGAEQADTIEFGNAFSTEFALHVQDCLISY